jgi:hypothetical protein
VLLSPEFVLGLKVEFDDVDGAIECVTLVEPAETGAAIRENGEGVGRSLIDET